MSHKEEYKLGQSNRRKQMGPPGPGMGGAGEKAKDFKTTWVKLLKYCKKYWAVMVIALSCVVMGTVLTLIGPDKLSELTDLITKGIVTGIDLDGVARIGWTLVIFYGLSFLLSLIQGVVMATITQNVSKQLRGDISAKINRLPMWFYNKTTTGDVLSRVTNDVDTIGQSLNQSVGTLVSAITLLVGSLIMMLKTNVFMTITAIVATCIGFVLMMLIMGKSQKYFVRQQQHLGEINGHIEEIYDGHTIVKAYNGEAKAREKFVYLNNELRESNFMSQCLSGLMMPLMSFIGNFGYVAVCVVGAVLVMNNTISFGVIVAFILYVRYFTQPLSQLAQAAQSLQSAAAAGERVFEFLEAEEMEDELAKTRKLENVQGKVDFEHVNFGYEGSDKAIINDFSVSTKPGQKVAIVGPTGAGKTTIVNLLMRFHEIQSGTIKIDNIPVHQLRREDVHEQFCMVLQDTWIFEGTVRENLVYSTENVSEQTLEEACKAVGLHHFIRTLPHGYDTMLNDQLSLSAGQKQQLTIARAMIADRPMLILDEATSSVDTRTELIIQNAMDELMKGRTSFIIAHRLSTIKNADLILVMKDGDIIESGNHNELMKQGGFYADLYNSQFDAA
ncbi:ABC transporter ATP-binding protein [Lachnoclostridium phytofermentans]|uniref:ABC transporter related n=1 Tax=Lachnoclostridium phytofermentans (strain ATCC 700394 / DSM 18823 / ISDg) TaxID=357809 RepID=A9KRI0_LACP7|nr:ABC transporter ATP-binding protein [Lachnoclostridium phytofermentans]ABX42054.1 ABC transporter related [Lachnoclostridium phytofermentans ISDg]